MRKLERAYKYRIYPTKKQREQIENIFGCCRYVYNVYLDRQLKSIDSCGSHISYNQCSKDLTRLKKRIAWLNDADSSALQSSLKNLDNAMKRYSNGISGIPKQKSKKSLRQSYTSKCTNGNIRLIGRAIKLPKIGNVKIKGKFFSIGRIISATISRNETGHYYVSVLCTERSECVCSNSMSTGEVVIEQETIIVDNNARFNARHFKRENKTVYNRIERLQKILSRKTSGSKNYRRLFGEILKWKQRIKNKVIDVLHKLTHDIVSNHHYIIIKIYKNLDNPICNEFIRQIKYKSNWNIRNLTLTMP